MESVYLFFYASLVFWLTKCLNRAQKIHLSFWTSFTKMARSRWDTLFPNAYFAQYVDNSQATYSESFISMWFLLYWFINVIFTDISRSPRVNHCKHQTNLLTHQREMRGTNFHVKYTLRKNLNSDKVCTGKLWRWVE